MSSLIASTSIPSGAAVLAITAASSVIAAATASAGRWSHQRRRWPRMRVWYQTELDRLHGRPPCTVTSLQPVPALAVCARPGRPPPRTRPASPPASPASPRPRRCRCCRRPVQVGPGRRDQRLAAIGQHQQQLQPPVPPHPAQLPQRLPLQRVTPPRDHHHRGHPTATAATSIVASRWLHACTQLGPRR